MLIAIYIAYLVVLSRMPADGARGHRRYGADPARHRDGARGRSGSPRSRRCSWSAAESSTSLRSRSSAACWRVSTALGVPGFVFVQWVAPFVSEFPEKVSAFYWARTVEEAPTALMNMISSNINQWTLLTAMLPIVYSHQPRRGVGDPAGWRAGGRAAADAGAGAAGGDVPAGNAASSGGKRPACSCSG